MTSINGTSRMLVGGALPLAARPRTRLSVSARLEAPQRTSNDEVENLQHGDAFKELVALSKKQSVNRKQNVCPAFASR